MLEKKVLNAHEMAADQVISLNLNGGTVNVRFCRTESSGVKDAVRDILTNAYEERFQRMLRTARPSGSEFPQKGC